MTQDTSKSLRTRERKEFRFPQGYGDNRIVLLVRDPWWLFSYWEIRKDKEEEIVQKIENSGETREKAILRVYDVTDIDFPLNTHTKLRKEKKVSNKKGSNHETHNPLLNQCEFLYVQK